MSIPPQQEHSVREAYRVVLRHRKKVLLFIALAMLCTLTIVLILPSKYGSEAKLLVLVGRENVSLDPSVATGKTLSVNTTREMEINTLLEILKCREVLSKVVDKLGAEEVLQPPPHIGVYDRAQQAIEGVKSALKSTVKNGFSAVTGEPSGEPMGDPDMSRKEAAIEALSNCLAVSAGKNSTVVTVAAESRSPQLAQTLVSALVDVYTFEHTKIHSTDGSEDFFRAQKQLVGSQLADQRAKLNALRSEMGIGSGEAEYTRLENEKASIESLRNSLSRELSGTLAGCEALKKAIDSEEEMILTERFEGITNEATDGIRQQLYTLELAEGAARGTYTADHPDLRRIQAQLKLMRERFAEEQANRVHSTFARNPGRETLMLDYEQQLSQAAQLKAQLAAAEIQNEQVLASLKNLNETSGELDQLVQDVAFLERSYDTYSDSLEQTRIGSSLAQQHIDNVNVVQPASYVSNPVSPNRMLLLIAGALGSILGAIPLAFVMEYFDCRIKSPAEVEAVTELPVLVTLPRESHPLLVPELVKSTQDVG